MKRNSKDNDLEDIQIQPIDMEHHRTELRKTLLTSPYWQKQHRDLFLFLKGVRTMQNKTFVTAGVALSIVAIALALFLAFMLQSTKPALAAEVVQKSYQAVTTLTPEQQGALATKLQIGDPMEMLQIAKSAKDLKVLTYDQFASQYPIPENGKSPDLRSLTFLQFTDTNGTTVVLGINQSTNLPEFILALNGHPGGPSKPGSEPQGDSLESSQDGSKGFSFRWSDNNIKVEATINADGTGTFLVNGKKYAAPAGTIFSMDETPSVKIEGDDVYVNGIKLIPEN
jgi:hypothetical protein